MKKNKQTKKNTHLNSNKKRGALALINKTLPSGTRRWVYSVNSGAVLLRSDNACSNPFGVRR